MKIKFVLLLFCLTLLYSCKDKETQIAQSNIETYIETKFSETSEDFLGDCQILEFKHSDLFILEPLDTSKVMRRTPPVGNDEEECKYMFSLFDTFVGLSFEGCSRRALDAILQNDKNYSEWQTGAKEYVVISFVNTSIQHGSVKKTKELGFCFKLSQDLNILKVYSIPESDEDYIYIKLFGQTPKRFYGAVNCEYDFLTHLYDFYVKEINEGLWSIEWKYTFVKELNNLFGTEYFKLLERKDETVINCMYKLDDYRDKEVLKNRAHENVKSL